MEVSISPEMERIVQDLIEFGGFASPVEVFEAGIRQLISVDEFTEQDLADLDEAEKDIAAGYTFTLEEVRREFLGK
jgi:Arc/MetJ-type ribon-helix-helix transcriptional regulator